MTTSLLFDLRIKILFGDEYERETLERLSMKNSFYIALSHKEVWKTFVLHFAQIARGFLFLLFLSSCQGKKGSNAEDVSLSELKPELVVRLSGKKVKLSEINTDGEYALRLSDTIFFESLKKAKDFQGSISGKGVMEVSSTCLMNRERYRLNKKFSHYQSRFYILDLLPEEFLLKHKKKHPVSCSFLFVIRDKKQNEYLYNIPLLPLLSVGENSSLKILSDQNQPVNGKLLNKDNMSRFDLILEQERKAEQIKFLCEGVSEQEMVFMLNQPHTLISPFQLLQSVSAEHLPNNKKRCRILTYEKVKAGTKPGHSSQTYMANGVSSFFSIDFETLHEKPVVPEPNLLKEEPIIKSHAEGEVTLSEIKAGKKYTWSLSDEILFVGLNAFLKTKSNISQEQSGSIDIFVPEIVGQRFPVIEVLTTCLMKRKEVSFDEGSEEVPKSDRWTLKKEFTNYQSRFSILNLLPEELFLSYKKGSLASCSLSFVLRDKEGKSYTHTIPSLPVFSVEKNVFLKLLNIHNKEIGIGERVNAENMNHFSIVLQKERKAEQIKFLCEGLEEQMSFNLDSGASLFTPFPLLRSLQKKEIPSGKRRCRILTYGKVKMGAKTDHSSQVYMANGISSSFSIDFETLKNQESLWMPKENTLQIRIRSFSFKEISQLNKRQRGARGREDPIYITSVFEIPELFEVLPKNFSQQDYRSYKIKVDTECFSSILHKYKGFQEESLAAKTYYLPLLDSFSVMSVTPIEALQVYFPDDLLELLTEIHSDELRPNSKSNLSKKERDKIQLMDYRQWFTCSYHFQIQNWEGEVFSIDRMSNRPIHWAQGSYGLGFRTEQARKSFPLTFEEAKSMEMDLLFLQSFLKPGDFFPEDVLWPDEVTFLCGGRHPSEDYRPNFQTTYEKRILIQESSLQIPLAFFIDTDDFYKYLKENRFVKCRMILKKQDILRYFSQDLKLIYEDANFFNRLNSLSEDDTHWNFNSLSRFLYWL